MAGCAAGGVFAGPLLDTAAARVVDRKPSGEGTPAPSVGAAGDRVRAGVAAVVTGALLAVTALRLGTAAELAAYCVLGAGLVAIAVTDLRVGLVPRKLLYPTLVTVAVALVAASAAEGRWSRLGGAAAGGAAAFAVFTLVWWLYPKGMGFGDVRLAGLAGLALGWLGFRPLYLGFLAAFVAGSVLGVANLAVRGTTKFPFAPALATGTMIGVLWGAYLGNLWFHG